MVFKDFSNMEIDAIGEIINIGFGAASTAVSTLINSRVTITVPEVFIDTVSIIREEEKKIGIEVDYISGISGKNMLVIAKEEIEHLVGLLLGREVSKDELSDEITISAACELSNQMMGAAATALSEFLDRNVNILTPMSFEIEKDEQFWERYSSLEQPVVITKFHIKSENGFQAELFNMMPLIEVKQIIQSLMPENYQEEIAISKDGEELEEGVNMEQDIEMPNEVKQQEPQINENQNGAMQQQLTMLQMQQQIIEQMAELMKQMQGMTGSSKIQPKEEVEAKTVSVNPIHNIPFVMGDSTGVEQNENKELIMGVPLEVSVEIGRTKKSVREILEFTKGSLVVLDKLAGEQVELLVNGRCIAKGDVVVVEDNFGVRITEILNNGKLKE
ncbi:MAG: flagellar motor switch phosphatase FliY [Firmicutes bacterium]|uniref:Flagellar motor switch phosphatase FliY n=1 Tax=Candidatus Scybalomonas excrementavium TaxID=2840943 RepID=A0A9D9I2A1_9FIRM|nr:flagellar motor switch phosphatase FliY [Candidatus Scybalomonas excrementavium]